MLETIKKRLHNPRLGSATSFNTISTEAEDKKVAEPYIFQGQP